MSALIRYSRWLSQLKHKHHKTTLSKPFFSTITTTTTSNDSNHEQEPMQPGPPPIRVGFTDSAGRGVFATRGIKPGELIHTAKPVVCHPSLSKLNSVCSSCLRRLKPGNDSDPFCSNECREQSKGLKYPLLVKRLACMVISEAASADCIDILQPAPMLPEMEEEYSLLRSTLEAINVKHENMKFLTKQWYANVLARVRINAFRIEIVSWSYEDLLLSAAASVEAEAGLGNAVYILLSIITIVIPMCILYGLTMLMQG